MLRSTAMSGEPWTFHSCACLQAISGTGQDSPKVVKGINTIRSAIAFAARLGESDNSFCMDAKASDMSPYPTPKASTKSSAGTSSMGDASSESSESGLPSGSCCLLALLASAADCSAYCDQVRCKAARIFSPGPGVHFAGARYRSKATWKTTECQRAWKRHDSQQVSASGLAKSLWEKEWVRENNIKFMGSSMLSTSSGDMPRNSSFDMMSSIRRAVLALVSSSLRSASNVSY
mmetsp:Transcript_107517/g.342859  ORF Transcript_107517/g.342859 Transcript_107517/m.342859 type:complete len:233 (-) Transcript_107517:1001-1699(-)